MTTKVIVEIGYERYALEPDDVATLLKIAMRGQRVERPNHNSPWHPAFEQTPFLKPAEIGEVNDAPIAPLPEQGSFETAPGAVSGNGRTFVPKGGA